MKRKIFEKFEKTIDNQKTKEYNTPKFEYHKNDYDEDGRIE